MRNIIIFLAILLPIQKNSAQNYLISFAATGASKITNTVKVENLTRGTSIALTGTDKLRLLAPANVDENDNNSGFDIYPNPLIDYCSVNFNAHSSGPAIIQLFDLAGKKIASEQFTFSIGTQSFNIKDLSSGFYLLKINSHDYSYTGKFVSNCIPRGRRIISLKDNIISIATKFTAKSALAEISMEYNKGDLLRFTGTSGNYSTIVMDIPGQSKTVPFNYTTCTDGSGNNYPVVDIGCQLWMAENLKTTKYNNNNDILYAPASWDTLTTPAYCWYNNEDNNKPVNGALYNGYCIDRTIDDSNNICPKGWHVPTDGEWEILTDYLGGGSIALGKMKETGTTHWSEPNTGATNETGFNALPAGTRLSTDGSFSHLGESANFWTSTFLGDSIIKHSLYSNNIELSASSSKRREGFSVRCVANYKPIDSILNTRPVTTLKDGKLTTWTIGIDGGGDADGYLTMAASLFKGDKTPKALPDSGRIPANSRHPEVQLHYSNDDNVNYQARYVRGKGDFTFAMPDAIYSKLFLFFTSAEGASMLNIELIYNDTTVSKSISMPDYYNSIPATDPVLFNLVNDLAKWNKSNKMTESNHHYIDGIELHPLTNKALRAVKVTKGLAGYLLFWGATGVAAIPATK